jgi:hypothetical protein
MIEILHPTELQENTSAARIRGYLRKMDKLVALLGKYHDAKSLAILEEKRTQLQGMMSALGLDENGKDASKSESFQSLSHSK